MRKTDLDLQKHIGGLNLIRRFQAKYQSILRSFVLTHWPWAVPESKTTNTECVGLEQIRTIKGSSFWGRKRR